MVKIYTCGCNSDMLGVTGDDEERCWLSVNNALWDNNTELYDPVRFRQGALYALQSTMDLNANWIFDATELWKLGSRQENSTAATN